MEFGGNTNQQAIYCQKPQQSWRSQTLASVLQRDKQYQVITPHTTAREGEKNVFLHWEFSNKWLPDSHSACFSTHPSWQLLVKLAKEKGEGNRRLCSGHYFEAEKPINRTLGLLYAGPTKGQDAIWVPKWRSQSHFLAARAPESTCHTIYKVVKDVRFYDCRISICLNYTLALLKARATHSNAT